MAQQVLRARVSVPSSVAGIDTVSWDFVFEATGADVNIDFGTHPNPTDALHTFFVVQSGGAGNSVGSYMSPKLSVAGNSVTVTYTDITNHLDGSNAGSPVRTDFDTYSWGTQPTLPPQAAVVIGYRADYGSALEHGPLTSVPSDEDAIDQGAPATHPGQSRPRSRLRGRLFLGPLNEQALGVNGDVGAAAINDLGLNFNVLAKTHNPGNPAQWNLVQWSRRGQAVSQITHYYVSEGFATQRRRVDTAQARVHPWVTVA